MKNKLFCLIACVYLFSCNSDNGFSGIYVGTQKKYLGDTVVVKKLDANDYSLKFQKNNKAFTLLGQRTGNIIKGRINSADFVAEFSGDNSSFTLRSNEDFLTFTKIQ